MPNEPAPRAPLMLDGSDLTVVVVRSRFNPRITGRLLDGALGALEECRVPAARRQVLETPGAVELPFVADRVAERGGVDAIVCLGCVIRGETPHFDFVCRMAAEGILRVGLERKIPVSFGVLTCENKSQALARSAAGEANRGADAARAAVEMALLARRLKDPSPFPRTP